MQSYVSPSSKFDVTSLASAVTLWHRQVLVCVSSIECVYSEKYVTENLSTKRIPTVVESVVKTMIADRVHSYLRERGEAGVLQFCHVRGGGEGGQGGAQGEGGGEGQGGVEAVAGVTVHATF